MIDKKNFNSRNELKQYIHFGKNHELYPKAGEIWYINLGINIGSESIGKGDLYKRPVLIIKKLGNMFFVVPMTTKGKDNNPFYYKIDEKYFNKNSHLVLSQIKSIDKKRFILKIGELINKDLYEIKKELKNFLF